MPAANRALLGHRQADLSAPSGIPPILLGQGSRQGFFRSSRLRCQHDSTPIQRLASRGCQSLLPEPCGGARRPASRPERSAAWGEDRQSQCSRVRATGSNAASAGPVERRVPLSLLSLLGQRVNPNLDVLYCEISPLCGFRQCDHAQLISSHLKSRCFQGALWICCKTFTKGRVGNRFYNDHLGDKWF